MNDSPVNQPHYTIKQVAEMLCVTPATIRRHIKAGELAYVEISKRKWVIPEDSLKVYLARRHRVLLEDKKDELLEAGTQSEKDAGGDTESAGSETKKAGTAN